MLFLWNILLSLVWCLLRGRLDLPTLAAGFLLGFFALRAGIGPRPGTPYFTKPYRFLKFFFFFLREMHIAQFRVAYDVVTHRHRSNPGIIAYPLDAGTEAEIATFACVLTLTPGTMALEVSPDRRTLYVHIMFIPSEGQQALSGRIKRGLELPLLELMR